MALEDLEGFELLPDDEIEVDPDEELDAAIDPDDPLEDVEVVPDPPAPFGRGWSFDPVSRQFERYGRGVVETQGLETLKIWILKTLHTAQYAHEVYSDDYGHPDPFGLLGHPEEGSTVQQYQEGVEEALLMHDRITDVQDFEVLERDPLTNYLEVQFTVVIDDTDDLEIASRVHIPEGI